MAPGIVSTSRPRRVDPRVQHCGRGHADPNVEFSSSPSTIRRLVEEGLPVAPLLQVLGRVNKHQDRRLVGVDGTAVVHATQLRLRRVPSIIRQVGRRGRRDRRYTLTVGGGPVRFRGGLGARGALSPHVLRDADGGRGSPCGTGEDQEEPRRWLQKPRTWLFPAGGPQSVWRASGECCVPGSNQAGFSPRLRKKLASCKTLAFKPPKSRVRTGLRTAYFIIAPYRGRTATAIPCLCVSATLCSAAHAKHAWPQPL